MQAILFLALKCHTRTHHLADSVGVVGFHTQVLLNALTLLLAVRLCADAQHAEVRVATRIHSLFFHHLIDAGSITWDGMENGSAEISDEFNLAFRVAGCSGNGQHAHTLSTILKTQSGSEHTVTGGVLEHILRTTAYHPQTTGNGVCPLFKVFLSVKHYGWVASRATR